MRNISHSMTTPQAQTQLKTVTRRLGWWFLKQGDKVQQVEKGMGLKKDEKVKKIHPIQIIGTCAEPLSLLIDEPEYGRAELVREGFPYMTPEEFVEMFCRSHKGCTPETKVNRLVYSYLSKPVSCEACYRREWKWSAHYIVCGFCGTPYESQPAFSVKHKTNEVPGSYFVGVDIAQGQDKTVPRFELEEIAEEKRKA